ncbi:MAG: holo-ACP synthase [Chromatiales bacterium]|nr:holo-ACP synthase [Gammaproteobacteria bacterium]MBW6476829.1 holo-ACP synthase [Chromatiales bacterium]
MIFGIGTDIVAIARMEKALARHGERFAERILAEQERAAYAEAARPARFLAKRFAAKEAAAKAFGTGFSAGLSLQHIVISHDARGRPLLSFHGQAEVFCRDQGVGEAHLSISDEQDYAIAFVTLMRGENAV